MGMFDSVMVPCPDCGKKHEFQSKGGDCYMDVYDLESCPADVMEDINRHAPVQCSQCGTWYGLSFSILKEPGIDKILDVKVVTCDAPEKGGMDAQA